MNILRLIKLKQLNGDLDYLDEKEKLFFSLFNNLNSVKGDNTIYFVNNEEYYFEYDLKNKYFCCSYDRVWSVIESEFNLDEDKIEQLIKNILKKHLNIVGITPEPVYFEHNDVL